ncbi:MAG: hypothetical protein OXC57_02425, partial [Rhodobacteraceae bacterium]|nr:hypothetical protein [Paracoccaceae bacterium]
GHIARESVQVKEKTGKGRASHLPLCACQAVVPWIWMLFRKWGNRHATTRKKMCGYGSSLTW